MFIRKAAEKDFEQLYALGLATPEIRVSDANVFMQPAEFRDAMLQPSGVFLVAEIGGDCAAFIYANTVDVEKKDYDRWACIVYVVVKSEYRGQGIASRLIERCLDELRGRGIDAVYAWAREEQGAKIGAVLRRHGFGAGHLYRWHDRKI